jgi:hypothetical protein
MVVAVAEGLRPDTWFEPRFNGMKWRIDPMEAFCCFAAIPQPLCATSPQPLESILERPVLLTAGSFADLGQEISPVLT